MERISGLRKEDPGFHQQMSKKATQGQMDRKDHQRGSILENKTEMKLEKRRWRWIGHTPRKPGNCITKKVLDWNPQGKRSRGRPRGTWRRVRESDVQRSGKSWNNVKKLAQDRENWKVFVCGLYPGPG